MQWSDVTRPPTPRTLRQFAALLLVFAAALAGWRLWQNTAGAMTFGLAGAGAAIGLLGLIQPTAIRWIYTAWLAAAFPIGWVVSKLVLGMIYYVLFMPIAFVFRLAGRDALRVRKDPNARSYWTVKPAPTDVRQYFRQF
jgi:hypothetical protein